MGYDLGSAIGFQLRDKPVSWTRKDLITYALGVGAKRDDLPLVYELDKSWGPLPTYPVVLSLKGEDTDVSLFASKHSKEIIPGLPKLDPKRVVHATQSIEVLRDLPQESGPGWRLSDRIVGVHENKSGIIVDTESLLLDPKGTAYAKLYSSAFYLGSKGNGGKFSKAIASAPQAKPIPKNRKPGWVVREKTSPEQALIYRLSGDYNPLHIDPEVGKALGFGDVILHGLSSYGFTARALIRTVGKGDRLALRLICARFSSPVAPGDELETQAWEIGPGPQGTTEIAFITKDVTTGRVALSNGIAYVKTAETTAVSHVAAAESRFPFLDVGTQDSSVVEECIRLYIATFEPTIRFPVDAVAGVCKCSTCMKDPAIIKQDSISFAQDIFHMVIRNIEEGRKMLQCGMELE